MKTSHQSTVSPSKLLEFTLANDAVLLLVPFFNALKFPYELEKQRRKDFVVIEVPRCNSRKEFWILKMCDRIEKIARKAYSFSFDDHPDVATMLKEIINADDLTL